MNKAAREVARNLCGHLDNALRLHRSFQEEHVFPAVLASVDHADGLADLVAGFVAEHMALEGAWQTLRPTLAAVALCRPAMLSIDETTRFAAMYREHVAVEARHLSTLISTDSPAQRQRESERC